MPSRSVESFQGRITDCPTAIIVNLTNNSFDVERSVSREISEAYESSEFASDSLALRSAYAGKIAPPGEVVVAPGMTRQNQWIFHVVLSGLVSESYNLNKKTVHEVMTNVLLAADGMAARQDLPSVSLGFPLYGCEDNKFYNWGNVFSIVRDAMLNYFERYQNSRITRICLVHPDEQACMTILKELVNCAPYLRPGYLTSDVKHKRNK